MLVTAHHFVQFVSMEIEKLNIHYDEKNKVVSRKGPAKYFEDKGLGWHFWKCMKKNADRIAQIHAVTEETQTFGNLLQRCIRLAIALQDQGIAPGDVILICSYNSMDNIVPYISSLMIGAIICSTDPTISLEDHKHLVKLVSPKMIFHSNETKILIEDTLREIRISAHLVNFENNFKEMVLPKFEEANFEPEIAKNPGDTAVIHFSSGTTGLAKGICLSHSYFLHNISNLERLVNPVGTLLGFATTYWVSNSFISCFSITKGVPRLVCPSFEPKHVWDYIEKYKVQFVIMAPSQAIRSYKHLPKNYKANLGFCLIGGSSVPPNFFEDITAALPQTQVFQGYGLTEIGILSASIIEGVRARSFASCGLPVLNVAYKVVDETTDEALGFNQQGEIRIKSPHTMNGYYNQDSSSCWDKDGFLKSGDVGYYDENFNLYITDRSKDMFKYLSWHIVPAKLESILLSHPEVEEAAVIGMPHHEDDNHAMGIVVRSKNSSVSGEDLEKFVEGQVDDRNRLRAGVRFVEIMPYTPSGKIKKRELRDMVLNERPNCSL